MKQAQSWESQAWAVFECCNEEGIYLSVQSDFKLYIGSLPWTALGALPIFTRAQPSQQIDWYVIFLVL